MTGESQHTANQREFYETRSHAALRPREGDLFVRNLVTRLVAVAGIERHHRVLEVGAGFGRFTLGLLDHCHSVTAVDLSSQALAALEQERESRGIEAARVRTVHGDIDRLDRSELYPPYDAVVGFFVLHHLENVGASLERLTSLVDPDGIMAFLEPNRWNPSYMAQVACCPDMRWREEKGVWKLAAHAVEGHFRRNGLEPVPTQRLGFFPPQLYNRFDRLRRLESLLERQRVLLPVLPFLILAARRPKPASDPVGQ